MKRFLVLALFAAWTAAFDGCKPSANTTAAAGTAPLPTAAQARLPTIKLWIGPQVMTAEMALTPLHEETGMMFRTNMEDNDGMIFVFAEPIKATFWMKNTVLPLSAAYIAPDGTIREIHDLQPLDTNPVVAATDNIQYVLETPRGWFQRNNVGTNTVVSTEHGPLRKVFQSQ